MSGSVRGAARKGRPYRDFKCNLLGALRDVVPLIRLFGWGREADKSIAALALPASAWTGFARMKNARHPKDCATFGRSSSAGMYLVSLGFKRYGVKSEIG